MLRALQIVVALVVLLMQAPAAVAQITDPSDPNYPGTICSIQCDFANGYDPHHDDGPNIEEPNRNPGPRFVTRGFFGRPELIISGPVSEFPAARAALEAIGAQLLRYRNLPILGVRFAVFDLRGADHLARAELALLDAAPNTVIGLHHIYDLAQARPRIYAAEMIGDAAPGACPLGRNLAIGLIDGPVDASHPALAGATVVSRDFLQDGERPPSGTHGTAVAALLVGQDPEGALGGFAPGARLYAASAFTNGSGDPGADVERIATAIEWLLQQDVRLINMSFARPANPVLEAVLSSAEDRGAIMVAAAGNDGRERAVYPAAHADVIAVTAVDAAFRRYRAANFGTHIEFAAPGVDLYVATRRGGNYASGTSYAAPIVTALAARLGAGGGLSVERVRELLRGSAVDLGPDGFDAEFGWGLVRGGC